MHAPAIAFSAQDNGRDCGTELTPTMRKGGDGGDGGGVQLAVAYTTKLHNTASNQAGKVYQEYSTSLDRSSPPPALLTAMQVRRLTPLECERLQGFPDDYTAIPWRKKPASDCPDGPRYKALGNSWAVPVVRWIGERIEQQTRIKHV
jgi:DNA (cytosine-5)-methyltransferase 1